MTGKLFIRSDYNINTINNIQKIILIKNSKNPFFLYCERVTLQKHLNKMPWNKQL